MSRNGALSRRLFRLISLASFARRLGSRSRECAIASDCGTQSPRKPSPTSDFRQLAADLAHAAFGSHFVVMLVGLGSERLREHGRHGILVARAQRAANVELLV